MSSVKPIQIKIGIIYYLYYLNYAILRIYGIFRRHSPIRIYLFLLNGWRFSYC
jgi:hypothetical protein